MFNSDWINKSHFSAVPPPNITPIKSNHPTDCVPSDNAVLKNYLESGAMKDVRMVNDPNRENGYMIHLVAVCRTPTLYWLIDTLSCSADDGHSMETIVRELKLAPMEPSHQRIEFIVGRQVGHAVILLSPAPWPSQRRSPPRPFLAKPESSYRGCVWCCSMGHRGPRSIGSSHPVPAAR